MNKKRKIKIKLTNYYILLLFKLSYNNTDLRKMMKYEFINRNV